MADLDRLAQDLGFVRRTVAGSGPRSPVAVYFLWAAIVLAGFALADVRPLWVGYYWFVAGPLGGAVSGLLAQRDQQRRGEVDRGVGLRWALHWGAFMGAIVLLVLMPARGVIEWPAIAPIILLFVALTYFYAGLHLDRPLLW